ncbi:MAG: thermonuclease family protein [Planctomycetota bacterium]|nr:thermonuclease family protein [Planctomycetota bacterium]
MGGKERKPATRRPMTPANIALLIFVVLAVLRFAVFRPELASDGKPRTTVFVQRVIDGDTFDLDDGTRVRMLGIDAPEAGFGDKRPQPFSAEATEWLRNRIEGHEAALRIDYPKVDRYGRTLAWVFEADGTLVNEEMLREGRVKLLADFGLPADLEPNLRKAEAEARIRKIGIWAKKRK